MKIALVGGAPSSAGLAPYDDPSWQIWACSPSAVQHVKRFDAWFEIHPWRPGVLPSFPLDYVGLLVGSPVPVYMQEVRPEVRNSVAYPRAQMEAEFGSYFFTSSVAWMLAKAITDGATEIGLYGIDMAHRTEYAEQRPGCHFFMTEAKRRGIKLNVPPQSDILQPPPAYGYCEIDPLYVKLMSRKADISAGLAKEKQAMRDSELKAAFYEGCLSTTEYMLRTWVA